MGKSCTRENNNGENRVDDQEAEVVVVMVPLPAQGHLNQLLQLSRLISAYNIPVHYVAAAAHCRQAKVRLHGWDLLSTKNIHFHELPTPTFETPPPDHSASASRFPSQLLPSFHATLQLREPAYSIIHKLSATARRVSVVYDSLMAYVIQDVGSIENAESYCFHSVSAFSLCSFWYEATSRDITNIPPEAQVLKEVLSRDGCFTEEFSEFAKLQSKHRNSSSGDLYNASRVVETTYIDLLKRENFTGTDKHWAIGPFNPVELQDRKDHSGRRHKCLEWLDEQAPNSVIFVSFGTTTSLPDEEIKKLATGLEESGQKFIWVVRDADKGDVFEGEVRVARLPEGYEERVEGRGFIVRDWAPQLEILGHPSTGGFMSHCGWNSCFESISMGVPIAAWPMHSDQPKNSVLVTKVLKIGIVVKEWALRDELVESETIKDCVRRLMDSAEGDEMRLRASELSCGLKQSLKEGGVTKKERDSFIAHITR